MPKRRLAVKVARTAVGKLSIAKPARRQLDRSRAQPTQRRRQPVSGVKPNGMSVFGLLSFAGAFLALVFVVALHWQRQALQVGQQEVELRSQIDLSANERRQLQVEQNKARSPRETSEHSRQVGLEQYKLDVRPVGSKPKTEAKSAKSRDNEPGTLHSVTPLRR